MNLFIFRLIMLIRFINIFSKIPQKFPIKNSFNNSKSKINYFNKPKISIILPIYDIGKYLDTYFHNLLNQTFKNIEIICLNYGLSDKSLLILKKYEKIDRRIIIVSQFKENISEITNYGINIAKGEYLLFLNKDIFFSKNMIYDIIKEADKKNVDIMIYGFEKYNRILEKYLYENFSFQKKTWLKEIFNYSINSNEIFTSFYPFLWNKLFSNTFIKTNNLYFVNKLNSINLFFTNIALIKAPKISILNKYFVYYKEEISQKIKTINNLNPLYFYKHLLKLKEFLEEQNYFLQLEDNFKKFGKKACIYYLKNNKEKDIFIYEKLKKNKFQKLGIDIIPSNLISQDFHEKYLNHFYFKHINLINEKLEVHIIKKTNYQFKPKVSVIIPVYNVEKYIIKCIDSILKQKLYEIEIIVVNDGSTDNSLQIIQNFTANNSRIKILNQDNRGLSVARNTGFKYSNGEYIYFIDGDDYLDENCLFDLYNEAINNNLDIIFFNADSFLDEIEETVDTILIGKFNKYLIYYHRKGNYERILNGTQMFLKMKQLNEYRPSVCLQFIKKEFYIQSGLSFYPGILHEDNLFSFMAILLANRTSYMNKTYYNRRVRLNSIMTSSFTVKNLYGYLIVCYEMLKFLEKNNFQGDIRTEIRNEFILIRKEIEKIYNQISEDEKYILYKKLTINQEILFKNIVEIIEKEKKIWGKEKKIKKLKKQKIILLLICILISFYIIYIKKNKVYKN